MKLFTDTDDIGLIDGLILFLTCLYLSYKLFGNFVITRMELVIFTLIYLYGVVLWIRAINLRKRITDKIKKQLGGKIIQDLSSSDTFFGIIFCAIIEMSVGLICIYILFFNVGGTEPFGIYNRIYFFGYDLHSLTALTISISFYIHWKALKYLYPLKRFIVNLAITGWYTYFGGVVWTTFSVIYRGNGFWYMPYLGLVFITTLLMALDKRGGFIKLVIDLKTKQRVYMLLCTQLLALIMLSSTGFWADLNLSDAGLGPDPNISVFWVIWKVLSFTQLYPLIAKYDLEAPKKMDSVII